jgi:MFS family permease
VPAPAWRRRFGGVLHAPHVRPLLLVALVARLPIGIDALAIVLFMRETTGSYAIAGAVSGAFALGGAMGAPLQGRLVDRYGQRLLLPVSIAHGAGLASVVALGSGGAPTAALVPCALLAGLAIPPISSVLRTLWPDLLRDRPELLPTAFALDSVLIEFVFVFGPLVTAAVVALVSPAAAIGVAIACVVLGTAAFTSSPPSRAWRPAHDAGDRGALGALGSPGIRTLVLAAAPLGFCFGAVEVTLPAFSDAEGSRELSGLLLATWALGSAIGGLAYGAAERSGPLVGTYLRLSALLPLGFLPLAAAPSIPVMLLLAAPAGLAIAPLLATVNQLVGHVAPAGAATEAYTWPITAMVAGVAAGTAAAGGVVEAADWRLSFLIAAGAAALTCVVAVTRRRTLVLAA